MPYFICPRCKQRSIDIDAREGFTADAPACRHCGFGFLFELMDDYYPGPNTGFVVCDQECRVLATGRGVFELTGFRESDVIGREVLEAFGMASAGAADENHGNGSPAREAVTWGARRLGKRMTLRTRSGIVKGVVADFFPAYDEDGGLLVAISPA